MICRLGESVIALVLRKPLLSTNKLDGRASGGDQVSPLAAGTGNKEGQRLIPFTVYCRSILCYYSGSVLITMRSIPRLINQKG